MPRVLRIINRFNLGGITYNVSYLSKYLPREYETLLIGGPEEPGEESSLYIPHSVGLEPVIISQMRRSVNPFSDIFAYMKIRKIIREFRPDIVHTHASKAGAIGRLAAIHCNVPVIVHTFHGHVFKGYFNKMITNGIKIFEKYLASKSDAIIAISKIQKEELVHVHNICKADKIFVIPLGFDLEKFRTDTTVKRERFRNKYKLNEIAIGIIGRLAPIKNHFLFIDAIGYLLKHSGHSIKALIIGDGEMKDELMNYIKSQGMSYASSPATDATFIFTSWIREVDEALAGIDIVCLSSKNEGTPVSLIEAQAAGKFIVATNVGGTSDILEPGGGLLSEPGDDEAYKKNLLFAVDNFNKLVLDSSPISDQVTAKFSYKRLCHEMDHLYKELLMKKI
jgi:glycosyltransferase involved in cell wall biosynthesis